MIPRLSIVVPFYNVEDYFEEFLNSLLPISNEYEVILVNDGTKDNSRTIAEKYALQYENVTLVDKENGGLSSARNFGFNMARGEYVLFFDSDDYIEDKFVIDEMLEKAIATAAEIVVAPYYEFFELKDKKYRLDKVNFIENLKTLEAKLDPLFKNNISFAVWNKMYKSDFLKNNNLIFKEGIWFEDLEFVFRAFYFASCISKVDSFLIGYRQRDGSIMKTVSPKILDKVYVCDELLVFLDNQNTSKIYLEKFKILYLRMAFSVIFTLIVSKSTKDQKREILKKLFNHKLFNEIFKKKLEFVNWLSKSEKILYKLIKFGVLNQNNIMYTSIFKYVKK